MNIKIQRIEEFLGEVASRKPTPGGGAVAAVAGAMAAALVEKVCELTKDKDVKILGYKANKIRQQLLKLADEDCLAFDEVMTACKFKDKEKIKKALQKAIDVPEQVKMLAGEVEKLAEVAAEKGNKNAHSDALSAIYLARAAAKSAEENVKINTKTLGNL